MEILWEVAWPYLNSTATADVDAKGCSIRHAYARVPVNLGAEEQKEVLAIGNNNTYMHDSSGQCERRRTDPVYSLNIPTCNIMY